MSVINSLSSVLGEKGSKANIALAELLANSNNKPALDELIKNLENKDKRIQSDCIKVIYETGYRNPDIIAPYLQNYLKLLSSKNNRMVWGAMVAIACIADFKHKEIFDRIDLILKTIKNGSVITIDCWVGILSTLNKYSQYFDKTDPLLSDQLWICPIKQLPMYIEKSLISITSKNKELYLKIIDARFKECEKDSQQKRLTKLKSKIATV